MGSYRRGDLPSFGDVKMRKLMRLRERFLRSLNPQGSGGGESAETETTTDMGSQKLGPVKTSAANFDSLGVQPAGSVKTLSFTGTPTLNTTETVQIAGTFKPESENDTITLISDGRRWYEIARTYTGTNYLACPVIINVERNSCNPIFKVLGWTNFTGTDAGGARLTVNGTGVAVNMAGDNAADFEVGFTDSIWGVIVNGDISYPKLMAIRFSDETVHFGDTTGTAEFNVMMRAGFGSTVNFKRTATAINYAVTGDDYYIGVSNVTTGSPRTITLPAANSEFALSGRTIVVKDESGNCSGSFPINVTRSGSDLIDGQITRAITSQWGSQTFISNGVSQWFLH